MNKDDFYAAFMETAPPAEPAPAAPDEIPEKDTYTRAEVEELINSKINEILKGENDNGSNEEGSSENTGNEGGNNDGAGIEA